MKQIIHKTLGIAIIAFFSQAAMATDVTSTFTTGATLTAAQMTEIRTAVNSKQNIVSGTCPAGQSIRVINANGTVTCDTPTTHYLMIPAAAFRPVASDTTLTGGSTNPYMNITGGTLFTIAPVDLPHGAVITELSARAWDVSTTNSVTVDLRKFTGTSTTSSIASIATTTAGNVGYYNLQSSILSETVDLSTTSHNFYYLVQTLEVAGTNSGPGVYAVRITYTY